MSFFINGTKEDQLPLQSFNLSPFEASLFMERNRTMVVGASTEKNRNSFFGNIADLRYYEVTLDNREINALFRGNDSLSKVYIDSECRCPASHPRIADYFSRMCLTNDPTSMNAEMRINERAHPLEFITDGDVSTFWLSKLINKVVITIDLKSQYQIFYILIQFYSPLPKKIIIERQLHSSNEWLPWQYYADDCMTSFNFPNNGPLMKFNDTNCIQLPRQNSPTSLGNISFSSLQLTPSQRPGASRFFESEQLLNFVKTNKIRLTFDGHMYGKESFINERHLYFGVFEITASGRCDCNGFSSSCVVDDASGNYTCKCEGNTAGKNCEKCDDLFNAKPFNKNYNCKACECNGHAKSCVYNSTVDPFPNDYNNGNGGICVNCGGNTEGVKCEKCLPGYYKPWGANKTTDPCLPCGCNFQGTLIAALGSCDPDGGFCQCKRHVEGVNCNRCKSGFYGLDFSKDDGCSECSCNIAGAANNINDCDQISGRCTCKQNVGGSKCDTCKFGYHSLSPNNSLGCEPCQCDPVGASSIYCDPVNGKCPCRKNVEGQKCNMCSPRYYNLT